MTAPPPVAPSRSRSPPGRSPREAARRHVRAGRADDQPALERRGEHRLHGPVELRGHEQAAAAHREHARMAASSPAIRSPLARTWASRSSVSSSQTRTPPRRRLFPPNAPVVARDEAASRRRPPRAARRPGVRSQVPSPGSAHPAARRCPPRRRTSPCGPSPPAPRRTRAARRSRRRAARGGEKLAPGDVHAALSLHGLDQDAADLRPQAAASEAASFRRAKRTPSSSGSNAARLSGWPVAASAPHVLAVERSLQRHDARLAGRLARVLERRLHGLRRRSCRRRTRRRRTG